MAIQRRREPCAVLGYQSNPPVRRVHHYCRRSHLVLLEAITKPNQFRKRPPAPHWNSCEQRKRLGGHQDIGQPHGSGVRVDATNHVWQSRSRYQWINALNRRHMLA